MWTAMPSAYAYTCSSTSLFSQKLTCGTLDAYIYSVIHRKRPMHYTRLFERHSKLFLKCGKIVEWTAGEQNIHSRCLQDNSWNKINSKCGEVALLGRLRMIPGNFQNFTCRDSLKTLAPDHLNVETPTDMETDYSRSWFLLSQVSNSSARCWQACCPVIVVRHLQCNP